MNQVKNRLSALSMLDRAFRLVPDEKLITIYGTLSDDAKGAVQEIAEVADEGLEGAALIAAVRSIVQKGRINGDLERMALVFTDACLGQCITALGDNADDPSEENLREVLPAVIETHGLDVAQVMLASVVCGEAIAAPIITRILKHDEAWKLPPAPAIETAPAVLVKADSPERAALKEQRRARKAAEQEAARRRREQMSNARRK